MVNGATVSGAARLLADSAAFQRHIQWALQAGNNPHALWDDDPLADEGLSVVLLLLGDCPQSAEGAPEPCLILNKRSARVPQPGDLCCPGGGIEPRLDRMAAHLLRLPLSPLRQWPFYRAWRLQAPRRAARLRLLLAAALREGVEEMRLNPLEVRFLGGLPPEHLVMFKRTIAPLVGWVRRQRQFRPNWEVERIVRIPLRELLEPDGYIALRLQMVPDGSSGGGGDERVFPAFRFRSQGRTEILWGATYRIAMQFLVRIFDFCPPSPLGGPVVEKRLTADYLTGKG